MARQERPVDPADGPLQALAHGLRKLRTEAGSPTYRAMARRTGYSPSTLSEAASGRRKPTLDVLLAYVGALNGDADEWRERWEAVGDEPGTPSALPPAPATAAEPALRPGLNDRNASKDRPVPEKPEESDDGAGADAAASGPGRPRPGRSGRVLAAAGVALAVAAAVAVAGVAKLGRHRHPASTPVAAATPGCPATAKNATFFARTYGSGTTIRQGPARAERPIVSVPAGCTVGLTGYCAGEPIIDSTAYTPDVRWFMVAGGGVLASATVHGNPPAGMPLSHCPGERPLPAAITLHLTKDRLTAEGRHVEVVGYAAYYDGSWHQIGLTGPGRGDFAVGWHPVNATVAAAACLGGEAPTGVTDLRAYPAGGESRLPEAERQAAGRIACLYPTAN